MVNYRTILRKIDFFLLHFHFIQFFCLIFHSRKSFQRAQNRNLILLKKLTTFFVSTADYFRIEFTRETFSGKYFIRKLIIKHIDYLTSSWWIDNEKYFIIVLILVLRTWKVINFTQIDQVDQNIRRISRPENFACFDGI